jgi:hypothetical protein
MTIVADTPTPVDALEVTVGIDTHADSHVAGVIDPLGRTLVRPVLTRARPSMPSHRAGVRQPRDRSRRIHIPGWA